MGPTRNEKWEYEMVSKEIWSMKEVWESVESFE